MTYPIGYVVYDEDQIRQRHNWLYKSTLHRKQNQLWWLIEQDTVYDEDKIW